MILEKLKKLKLLKTMMTQKNKCVIHIPFSCDFKGCQENKSIPFDGISNSWFVLIDKIQSLGWRLKVENNKITKSYCPKHPN